MAGPWEDYAQAKPQDASAPWLDYKQPAAPATATMQPETPPFQRQSSFGQQLGRTLASTADIVTGVVPAVIGGVTYATARAMQRTPEQATAASQKIAAPFEQPFGRVFGVTETPEYKSESSRQIMDFVSKNIAKGSDWISTQTGLPKADVENMINTLSFAVGPETVVRGAKAAPAVAKGVVKAGEKVAEKVPFTEARTQAKVNKTIANALDNDPVMMQRAADLFGQGLSLEQVAVQLKSPGLAALSSTALRETPTLAQARAAQLEQERVRNLTAAEQQVNQLRAQTQTQADLAPTQVNALRQQELQRQQAVLQAVEQQKQQALATQTERQAAVGRAIPETEQPTVGQTIQEQRTQQLKQAKETSNKEYESVWGVDKGNEFSLDPLSKTAGIINADVATALEPSLAPNTAKILQKFKTKPGRYDSLTNTWTEGTPATASLKDAHSIMKDINRDLAALEGSIDPKANVQRGNLMQLKASLEQAIEQGSSPEAFAAYKQAQTNYLKNVIEPYRKGWVANLERQGATGETILAPSKVTSTILSKFENTKKFLSTFGDNPVAMDSVRGGIVDIYRSKVAPGGKFSPKEHASFMETYRSQIDALDKKGMGLREQLNSYAEQHGAAGAEAKTTIAQGKAKLSESKALATETEAKISEFKRQLKSKSAEDQAVVKEVEKVYNDAKNSRLSDPDYTPGESEFASVQRINDLANQVPGLKAELDRIYYSEQYQQLAKQGEELGLGVKKKGEAKTEPTAAGTTAKIGVASVPGLAQFKVGYDAISSYIKSKRGKSNDVLAARIAEELVNRPQAAITKAKTTVKAPKNALSNRQSTNALRPE